MGKLFSAVGRFGPLVAAIVVGVGGLAEVLFPGATPVLTAVAETLKAVGVKPDADVLSGIGGVVASALLTYGGSRKTYNIVRDKYFPKEQ